MSGWHRREQSNSGLRLRGAFIRSATVLHAGHVYADWSLSIVWRRSVVMLVSLGWRTLSRSIVWRRSDDRAMTSYDRWSYHVITSMQSMNGWWWYIERCIIDMRCMRMTHPWHVGLAATLWPKSALKSALRMA